MRQTSEALKTFFSGFNIPAYLSGNIPDNVTMPYITYDLIEPKALTTGRLSASVWYRSTGVTEVAAKADEIKAAIGTGISLPTESGSVILMQSRESPFIQIMNDPNRETKRALLNMVIITNTD